MDAEIRYKEWTPQTLRLATSFGGAQPVHYTAVAYE